MVVHVAYPESSDSSVTLLHDANAASSPSSPTAAVESKQPSDAITSPVLMAKGRKIKPFPDSAEVVEDKQPHLRMSTGSFTQSQQELLDQRRHTFCAMTADGRALLRRRSHDFTDYASMTLPHPNTAYLQARSKNHVHMRVYNKTDADDREISAHQAEGPAMVDVLCPSKRTVWRRGQPVCIEWKVLDESVEFVRIELMEQGSPATTTIAKEAPNNGFFTYLKVPWGMQSGPTYFLRISSTADPTRYMTTSFFQIGTAP
jgi:hypothetical protein